MQKLIATRFEYEVRDEHGNSRTHAGSYLGRKAASLRTLQRFAGGNVRAILGASHRTRILHVLGSYRSQWVAK